MVAFTSTGKSSGGFTLYRAADPDSASAVAACFALCAFSSGSAGPSQLTVSEIWTGPSAIIFSPVSGDGAPFWADALPHLAKMLRLSAESQGVVAVAWLASTGRLSAGLPLHASYSGRVINGGHFQVGDLKIAVPSAYVHLTEAGNALTFTNITEPNISLVLGPLAGQSLTGSGQGWTLPLTGSGAGLMVFAANQVTPYGFFQFLNPDPFGSASYANAPGMRYFMTVINKQIKEVNFPLFDQAHINSSLSFQILAQVDPNAPYDGNRTRFSPTGSDAEPIFTSRAFTNPTHQPLTLSPSANFGIHLAQRSTTAPNLPHCYGAPVGDMTVTKLSSDKPHEHLRCGLLAQESLRLSVDDTIHMVPHQAAYAVPSDLNGDHQALSFTDPTQEGTVYTTSWVAVTPAEGPTSSYYSQPHGSLYYGQPYVANAKMPQTVASKLRDFDASTPSISFPMVPHGLAFPNNTHRDSVRSWVNQSVTPDNMATLEGSALAPTRHSNLIKDTSHIPVFEYGDDAPQGGASATPGGLVASLAGGAEPKSAGAAAVAEANPTSTAPQGAWTQVDLALYEKEVLALTPPQGASTIPKDISAVLLGSQIFLPVTDFSKFDVLNDDKRMEIGGFTFELGAVEGTPADAPPILIFKFNTALSLEELMTQPAYWASTEWLADDNGTTKTYMQNSIDAVKAAIAAGGELEKLYRPFYEDVLTVPSWTGVISLNTALDGSQMPKSLQMLLAGMILSDGSSVLTAHHFGIRISRAHWSDDLVPQIHKSAMFAVIAYHAPDNGPTLPEGTETAFWTEEMYVQIENNSVTSFNSTIAVLEKQPFGRPASLQPDADGKLPFSGANANAVLLNGVYQQQGQYGTVSFLLKDPKPALFKMDQDQGARVLDSVLVTTANLLPSNEKAVSYTYTNPADQKEETGTELLGQVVIGGELVFALNPFGIAEGANPDLLGYGDPSNLSTTPGLSFNGLTLNIKGFLNAQGGPQKHPEVTIDYSRVAVSAGDGSRRDGSLPAALPITLSSALLSNLDTGLTASALKAQTVGLVQLQGGMEGATPQNPKQGAKSFTCNAPQFALSFQMPLGNLGSLSSVHASMNANLVIGWGPTQTTPGNDGIGLFVQLPSASAGYGGFDLEGVLKTKFQNASLMMVDMGAGKQPVYAVVFNNLSLTLLGKSFPPGVVADLLVFAKSRQDPLALAFLAKQTGGSDDNSNNDGSGS